MDILILGGGGREHALAWAIRQDPRCGRLWCAPGNAGIAAVATCTPLDIEDGAAVAGFAVANHVGFVVIGPEAPLAAGVSDALRAAGILTFGPSRAAAALEASKGFTKAICAASGAPTAAWARFTELGAAAAHIRATGAPIVVKADGLAAGKGVVVAETEAEALGALAAMFGAGHGAVVIEEKLSGEEVSLFALTDGEAVVLLPSAQDHKRAFDGDTGPNTGGMGAYSPAPALTDALATRALDEIIRPTLAEMARRGTPYQGVLYAGLMLTETGPKLIEYNARFGDPEAQVILPRLGAQTLDALLACAEGRLGDLRLTPSPEPALTVVLAARGYPGTYARGEPIGGLAAAAACPGVTIFHAGTRARGSAMVSHGGRVLSVTATAPSLAEARTRAYAAIDRIDWPGGFCRQDIGWRALPPR